MVDRITSENPADGLPEAVSDPRMAVYRMILASRLTQLLYAAARLRIADLIATRTTHPADLARETRTNRGALSRLLRGLVAIGILVQDTDDRFTLTERGQWLRSDVTGSLRPLVLLFGREPLWHAWGRLTESVMTGEPTARPQSDHAFLDRHVNDPEYGEIFDAAMTALTAEHARAVLEAYDFSAFECVVDVGGGHGAFLAEILKATPGARGVLFDLPPVIAGARPRIEREGLAGRCELIAGDCFASVPEGGDVYIMKVVIHDWDDDRSLAILCNCRSALRAGARLLIIEPVMPERVDASERTRDIVFMDLNMLVGTGGRERSEREFEDLFHRAGFQLTKIIPTSSSVSIVEGIAR